MTPSISTRNGKSQHQIFPEEIIIENSQLVKCRMAKRASAEIPEIYLADWLALFEIGPTEAGRIADCGQSYISNIMRGAKTNINVLYLLRLSEHMGVTVNDFYRPLPSRSQLASLKSLSPKAQATILARQASKS